jgi:tRNA(Ile)-lysidine synthase
MTARPATLLTLCRRQVRARKLWERGDTVLAAVSGGPDSMVMFHALALLQKKWGHRLLALGVDHGLRPEAASELDRAAAFARENDLAFERVRVAVAPGSNLQARARLARHSLLQEHALRQGASVVALGHTSDDRAETVLLRLLRGSGRKGLAAMPAKSPGISGPCPLVRPLLMASRESVLAHAKRHRVPFSVDPSNQDRRFLRVRVRTELLPLLQSMAPQIVAQLCDLASDLEQDGDADDPFSSLGRAQREQIKALLGRRTGSTTVRLSGGRDLELRFFRE